MGKRQQVHVNGMVSYQRDALNGIAQGTVLDPVLFVIYIDLPKSDIYPFADDTNIYREIITKEDRHP